MAIAVPLGLGAAVFVSEFCGGKCKETLKSSFELLAAIPSIVWGIRRLYGEWGRFSSKRLGAAVGVIC